MTTQLSKSDIKKAGRVFNYYQVVDEYLDVMAFTGKERAEVKLALTIKIEYAFHKDDKKIYKALDKRFDELKKIIKTKRKKEKEVEDMQQEVFYRSHNK